MSPVPQTRIPVRGSAPLPLLMLSASLVLMLAACSQAETASTSATGQEAAAGTPAAVDPQPSLLRDPAFVELDAEGNLAHWQLYQHAGDTSYTLAVRDGVATLERVGVEPWGQIEQSLPVDALAGKTLEWSAELSGELDDSHGEPLQSSGLSVAVTGFGPSDLPMMGARHLLTLQSEPGLAVGRLEPQRHRLRFVVPDGKELSLQLAVVLSRGGTLQVRAPRLDEVVDEPGAQPAGNAE